MGGTCCPQEVHPPMRFPGQPPAPLAAGSTHPPLPFLWRTMSTTREQWAPSVPSGLPYLMRSPAAQSQAFAQRLCWNSQERHTEPLAIQSKMQDLLRMLGAVSVYKAREPRAQGHYSNHLQPASKTGHGKAETKKRSSSFLQN